MHYVTMRKELPLMDIFLGKGHAKVPWCLDVACDAVFWLQDTPRREPKFGETSNHQTRARTRNNDLQISTVLSFPADQILGVKLNLFQMPNVSMSVSMFQFHARSMMRICMVLASVLPSSTEVWDSRGCDL